MVSPRFDGDPIKDAPLIYWKGDKGLRGCLARMFGKMRRFDAADGEERR
jgi:hypothetical protein